MKRIPKQTAKYLLQTLPNNAHADLQQLLIAVEDACLLLSELELAHAAINALAQLLTPKQKQGLIQQHIEQCQLQCSNGLMRHCAREAIIERSRCIHGGAQ